MSTLTFPPIQTDQQSNHPDIQSRAERVERDRIRRTRPTLQQLHDRANMLRGTLYAHSTCQHHATPPQCIHHRTKTTTECEYLAAATTGRYRAIQAAIAAHAQR